MPRSRSGAKRGKTFRIQVDGVEQVQKKLQGVAKAVNGILKATVRAGSVPFIKQARANAPRDTGFLRRSITHSFKVDKPFHVELVVGPGKKAYYGIFLERGTENLRRQEFLGPAFNDKKAEAERLMISMFKGAILSAAGGV